MEASRLERILKMVTVLQSERPVGPDELAHKMGVNKRSIYRDLNMLKNVGIPYRYDDKTGGYCVEETAFLPPPALKLSEALALLLAAEHITGPAGLPLMKPAQDAAIKIESSLPIHIQRQCDSILDNTSIRLPARARHEGLEEIFALLQKAIRKHQKVQLKYRSLFEKKLITLTLSPYHLHYNQRAWYIIGHSSQHNETRIFKLSRIEKLKPLPLRYLRDKKFNIEDYLGDAWSIIPEGKICHVKLQFSPKVAANVAEVNWHRTQKLTWHANGKLTFDVDVDGLGEITWWIMAYGDQVKVLAPKSLARKIAQTAQRIAKQYQS